MKEITREQIDNALTEVNKVLSPDVPDMFIENIKKYEDMANTSDDANSLKQRTVEMAVMFTAIQYSNEAIRGVLTKLLCDKEEE